MILIWGCCTDVKAQTEPESSENVVRIQSPHGGQSWAMRPGAVVSLKTKEGKKKAIRGTIQSIQDSAIVLQNDTIVYSSILSLKSATTQPQKRANIGLIVGGVIFGVTAPLGYSLFWLFVFGGSALAGIAFLTCLLLAPIGFVIVIVAWIRLWQANFKADVTKGWRIRIAQSAKTKFAKDPVTHLRSDLRQNPYR